jgi:hypothetical protein
MEKPSYWEISFYNCAYLMHNISTVVKNKANPNVVS